MSKQETLQPYPQQLSLDFKAQKPTAVSGPQVSKVMGFVDSATLKIRQQALNRIKSAGIFAPPKTFVK